MTSATIPKHLLRRLAEADRHVELDPLIAARVKEEIAIEVYQLGLLAPSAYLFAEVAELFSQGGDIAGSAGAYFYAADLLHSIGQTANETTFYERAASSYEAINEWSNAARALRFAALGCEQQGKPVRAAEYYRRAADFVRKAPVAAPRAVVDDLSKSLVFFAMAGLETESNAVYNLLAQELAGLPFDPSETLAVEKVLETLRNSGQERLAGKVYVDGMRRRLKAAPWSLSRVVSLFWDFSSCYGESWWRWLAVTFGFILCFAAIYMPSPVGVLKLDMKYPYQMAPHDFCWSNWVSAFSFSVTVFTTLGFGDVVPANSAARLIVAAEVFMGYAFLGVFVTLVSRKVVNGR